MILAIDVGNSIIVLGMIEDGESPLFPDIRSPLPGPLHPTHCL